MDAKFTEQINAWLTAPEGSRDCRAGALMLLQLSGNRIRHANLSRNPGAHERYIEAELQRYYNYRVRHLTHQQVTALVEEAESVAAELASLTAAAEAPRGRRDDHDTLPDHIRQIYADIAPMRQRLAQLHLKLRSLTLENTTCPDSERYPFAQEMVKLGRKIKQMWQAYDSYRPE